MVTVVFDVRRGKPRGSGRVTRVPVRTRISPELDSPGRACGGAAGTVTTRTGSPSQKTTSLSTGSGSSRLATLRTRTDDIPSALSESPITRPSSSTPSKRWPPSVLAKPSNMRVRFSSFVIRVLNSSRFDSPSSIRCGTHSAPLKSPGSAGASRPMRVRTGTGRGSYKG